MPTPPLRLSCPVGVVDFPANRSRRSAACSGEGRAAGGEPEHGQQRWRRQWRRRLLEPATRLGFVALALASALKRSMRFGGPQAAVEPASALAFMLV